ncbi:Os07g0165650, partial [Oryza sativa Japonica Group]
QGGVGSDGRHAYALLCHGRGTAEGTRATAVSCSAATNLVDSCATAASPIPAYVAIVKFHDGEAGLRLQREGVGGRLVLED